MNRIKIYTRSKNLSDLLHSFEDWEKEDCEIFSLTDNPEIDEQNSEIINVFILTARPAKILMNARYILCSSTPQKLSESDLAILYDLWPMPLTAHLVRFYFRALRERLKAELEDTSNQAKILEMARQDYLTGLATRWYLNEYAEQNAGEENITCIYLDLDHFKEVNDQYGHGAGDRALAATAEMIQNEFTANKNALAARMGGDEFMILLLGEQENISEKVNAFMKKLLDYYATQDTMHDLTVSAGIAQKLPGENKPIEQLIHESDKALYKAKKNGRNQSQIYTSDLE